METVNQLFMFSSKKRAMGHQEKPAEDSTGNKRKWFFTQ